ncbi:hypothetical protein BD408DRAFT_339555 [Parasitella parasitica]|nr:hypothetical protein BD408DRAFT_339555 [Parasitella parasitica]
MATKGFLASVCHICGKSGFIQKRNLREHYKNHDWLLSTGLKGRSQAFDSYDIVSTEEAATITVYQCPSCTLHFKTLEQLGNHIKQCHLQSGEVELESTIFLEPEDPMTNHESLLTIPPALQPGNLDVEPVEILTSRRRNFDEAVINACQITDSHLNDQKKTLFIVDNLQLKPLAMFNKDGTEQNVLAHERSVSRIIAGNDTLMPISPLKRSFDEMDEVACMKCAPTTVPGFERVLASSPYARLIRQRQYVELSPDVCKVLNNDWEFHPQVRYFTAKLLSGAIMHNTCNSQAIMANTVEAYGKTKHVDAHRETFGKEKDNSITTSIPPPIDTMYHDVWPVSLQGSDGVKLVIGTQVSNILITSSVRLDTKMKPCIGSKCMSFQLTTPLIP